MPWPEVDLLEGPAGDDPALDLALAAALLAAVAGGHRRRALRFYRPLPTVAFGRRDTFLPGFDRAARAARRHGFTPAIRAAGGRAAAYDQGCLVLDEIMPASDSVTGVHERFAGEAARQARALRAVGVDARVGELPGEYCPGEFSVNARGRRKLLGAAQRIVPGGWLLSTVVVVEASAGIRAVLEDVYAELGLKWDPATTGAVAEEVPGLGIAEVRDALLTGFRQRYDLVPGLAGDAELSEARRRLDRHRVP